MRSRSVERLLWTGSAAFALAAVALFALATCIPLEARHVVRAGSNGAELATPAHPTSAPATQRAASLDELMQLAHRDWRRPLFDPPPTIPTVKEAPPLAVRLLGTIVEPGHSRAILLTPDGKTELKAVGETAAGAEVLNIQPDLVQVRYLQNTVDLRVPRERPTR